MKIVIIGAGPCGLGAAQRLVELGHKEWILFEKEDSAGGLAASFVDSRGFTWDIGGHVLFSHYPEFDQMLEEVCGGELVYHLRKSFVKIGKSWVPYPFQNNLNHLPEDKANEALSGLKCAPGGNPSMSLDKWLEASFGTGIFQMFMRPYNQKVWATDLSQMASSWIAERISLVDFDQAQKNILLGKGTSDWGPNSTFMFPLKGGTGEIFRRLASRLPQDNLNYSTEVTRLDMKKRLVTINGEVSVSYDRLISTMPLDGLIRRADDVPDSVRQEAKRLRHSGTYVVGCGFEVPLNSDWSWMYFPEPEFPFNRVTNFARYSSFNVPDGNTNRYCSFMCETSFSDTKTEEKGRVVNATWRGLCGSELVEKEAPKASEFVIEVPYAYPVPTMDRDKILRSLQPYLIRQGVYSRGRFGGWLYEVGNMDHSYKQGRDVVNHLIRGEKETVWQAK